VVWEWKRQRYLELTGDVTDAAYLRPGDDVVASRELSLRRQVPLVFDTRVAPQALAGKVRGGRGLRVLHVCENAGLTWVLVRAR